MCFQQEPAFEGEAPIAKAGDTVLAECGFQCFEMVLANDIYDWDGFVQGVDEEGETVKLYGHNWTFEALNKAH